MNLPTFALADAGTADFFVVRFSPPRFIARIAPMADGRNAFTALGLGGDLARMDEMAFHRLAQEATKFFDESFAPFDLPIHGKLPRYGAAPVVMRGLDPKIPEWLMVVDADPLSEQAARVLQISADDNGPRLGIAEIAEDGTWLGHEGRIDRAGAQAFFLRQRGQQ